MCVLEFENREPGDQFYHLEHYIEGHYIKYNSNSGFVDENARFTPQVFYNRQFLRQSGLSLSLLALLPYFKLWLLGCHVETLVCN